MMESFGLTECLKSMSQPYLIQIIQSVTRVMDNKSGPIYVNFEIEKRKERFDPGQYR